MFMSLPFGLAVLLLLLAGVATGLHRRQWHPLASIPGPWLASLTRLYEFSFDCLLEGKFNAEVKRLHTVYGPIVRIGPNEVHISDPDFYDQVQNVVGKFDKDPWYYAFIGSADAGFGTTDAGLHRARRQAMSRFFAPAAVASLEQRSHEKILKLGDVLADFQRTGKVVNMSNVYRCLAFDNVSTYCLPRGFDMLGHTDITTEYDRQARSIALIAIWNRHLRIIFPVLLTMTKWYLKLAPKPASDGDAGFTANDYFREFEQQATEIVNSPKRNDDSVLGGIVNSNAIGEDQKTVDRLAQEARTLIGAGTETTAANLDRITYHVLSNPAILKALMTELHDTVASHGGNAEILAQYSTLQHLPYLTATINEGLRLSDAVSGRLPRISRRSAITYKSYVLPPGTVISVNIRDCHTDPTAFPDPLAFKPERWLKADESQRKLMEKYFVPFGRGARSCVGNELELLMLYLTVATFFWRFGEVAELYDTEEQRDLVMAHDMFAPHPVKESKGVRVRFRKEEGGTVGSSVVSR